jgi:pyridoxamine 5'-phosphate oxidase
MDLGNLRREYSLSGLRREDLDQNPITQFTRWLKDAVVALGTGGHSQEANAMTLATVDNQGRPSARVVLLKSVDERGFIFFTNYESRKGRQLATNPSAALVFYWAAREQQVNVAGRVVKISREESEAYFKTRPRRSCIAAWASHQSEVIAERKILEERCTELERQYPGEVIPTPPHWGGYVLSPDTIEFWQGRPCRLHDRFCYTKQSDGLWIIERLSP